MKLLAVLIALSVSLLACGPVIPMGESDADGSTEALRFREKTEGTWDSDCRSFTDDSGRPVSIRKQFKFNRSSAQIKELVFNNYSCNKPANSSESYSTKMVISEAVSENEVVVEFTNHDKREGHFLRERARMVLRNQNGLSVSLVGRSYIRNGNEEWMNEGDYDHDRNYSYTKAEDLTFK